jgi:preprotein translocase subunit SecB
VTSQTPTTPSLSIEKIYVKDLSFEAPSSPQIFLEQQAPEVHIELGITHHALNAEQGLYEVVLALTASARRGDKNFFLAEAHQAGIFRITGLTGEALTKALEIACAHVLLPFAREAINDLVTRGGFPQLLVNPMNFETLYDQKRAAQVQPAPATTQ